MCSLNLLKGLVDRLTGGAPGGGAGGDGVAGEVGLALGAGAAFFPAVLEEPVFGRDLGDVGAGGETICGGGFVFIGDVLEGSEGDEAGGFSDRSGVEDAGGDGGVEAELPADFIGHPVPDAGADRLVEEKGFEGFFGVAGHFFPKVGDGKAGVLRLGREFGPRVGEVVEHDAAEHAVVIENEGGFRGAQDEVVVFLYGVIGGGGGELAGHPEVDFEVELGAEGEEHALAVGFGGEEFFAFENAEGGGGAVAIDAGLGVGLGGEDLLALEGGPLAAGEFDFSEFGHGEMMVRAMSADKAGAMSLLS